MSAPTNEITTPQNWDFQLHPETAEYLITRSTILILCGLLGGILLSFQLNSAQKLTVSASCLVGIVAFLTVDGGINSRLLANQRRLRETRDTLNRRIELQIKVFDAQVRESNSGAHRLPNPIQVSDASKSQTKVVAEAS